MATKSVSMTFSSIIAFEEARPYQFNVRHFSTPVICVPMFVLSLTACWELVIALQAF